jgi:hypothetical protein
LIRWLAVAAKPKLKVEIAKDLYPVGEPVNIRATVLDETYKPVEDAKVVATIDSPIMKAVELELESTLREDEKGVYEAQYLPSDVSDYTVDVVAELKDEPKTKLTGNATFAVGQTLTEFTDAGQKVRLLEEISSASGGVYFPAEKADEVAERIAERASRKKKSETVFEQHDIWDTPLWFALLALALSAEWIIRRRARLV